MTELYKCNKCGDVVPDALHIQRSFIGSGTHWEIIGQMRDMHLCQYCTEAFDEWLKKKKR